MSLIDQVKLIAQRRNQQLLAGTAPSRRSTYVPPTETLLNGSPWVTVQTTAPLDTVREWIDKGLDMGVLDPDHVEFADDTVFLYAGRTIVNFDAGVPA